MKSYTIHMAGAKRHFINGKLHRDGGPAVVGDDGHLEYWINGRLHRDDGPAIVYTDAKPEFYLNHIAYPDIKEYCKLANITEEQAVVFILKYC